MKLALSLTLAALALASATHAAPASSLGQAGDIMVRGRLINLTPANDGGTASIGGKPNVGGDTVPEVDVTYFVTPNFGLELIAATTTHDVAVKRKPTTTDLGTVRLLPPTLTAQYHFDCPLTGAKPYVGAGLTYAHFYDAEHPGLASVKYDDTWGVALQIGADYKIGETKSGGAWFLNADVKKHFVSTDVTVNDTITAKANLNPLNIGVGVGYRF